MSNHVILQITVQYGHPLLALPFGVESISLSLWATPLDLFDQQNICVCGVWFGSYHHENVTEWLLIRRERR